MSFDNCLLTGTAYKSTGNGQPKSGIRLKILRIEKTGVIFDLLGYRGAISDAAGVFCRVDSSGEITDDEGFYLPKDSYVWIYGNFRAGTTNFGLDHNLGTKVYIPDEDEFSLEDLGTEAAGPARGISVKVDDEYINGLFNVLNFTSPGLVVSSPIAGTLNIAALASQFSTRETPTPVVDGVETVFTLSETPLAGSEEVFLNGLLQEEGVDYTIDGDEITMAVAPRGEDSEGPADKLRVSYRI